MNILVLTKRQYMGKDLLDDKFGRFWEVPLALARRGHRVEGIALSYRSRSEGTFASKSNPADIIWHSVNLVSPAFRPGRRYFALAKKLIGDLQPDIVWSCSDAYHAILGERLTRHTSAKHVIDLYDNFESYAGTRIPGVRSMLDRAVAAAHGITCVSAPLARYVRERYRSTAPTMVLENAVRPDLFRPMDRRDCRAALRLPLRAKIIGTAGALFPTRGIETLYRAFAKLADADSDIHLALAGPRPRRSRLPRRDTVHDLGVLPAEQVPVLINALDVGVVCNRDSSFGRYNFPQKAREIMACGVSMVGADVGAMRDLLQDYPECLFAPEDAASLAEVIRRQLLWPTRINGPVPTWSDSAASLETFFAELQRGQT